MIRAGTDVSDATRTNNSGPSPASNLFTGEPRLPPAFGLSCLSGPLVSRSDRFMCGIVGYVGRSEAGPILLDGLRRLEYRGYDSAGVAIVNGNHVETRKCAGRIADLAKLMTEKPPSGTSGISHTRWATHGKVTDQNAHPHFDASDKLALVHNGVIENYQALKDEPVREMAMVIPLPQTDTEVLAHLIGKLYDDAVGENQIGSDSQKARLVAAVPQRIATGHRHLRHRADACGHSEFHRRRPARQPARARRRQR